MYERDSLEAMLRRQRGVLYYGTSEGIPQGRVIYQARRPGLPEAIYCHPNDLPRLRLQISKELVHLREWQPTADDRAVWAEELRKRTEGEFLRYGEWR